MEYFNTGEIKDSQLFTELPISGKILNFNKEFVSSEYYIRKINGDEFTLVSETHGKFAGKFDVPLKLDFGTVILNRNRQLAVKPDYKIIFWNPIEKVKSLKNNSGKFTG